MNALKLIASFRPLHILLLIILFSSCKDQNELLLQVNSLENPDDKLLILNEIVQDPLSNSYAIKFAQEQIEKIESFEELKSTTKELNEKNGLVNSNGVVMSPTKNGKVLRGYFYDYFDYGVPRYYTKYYFIDSNLELDIFTSPNSPESGCFLMYSSDGKINLDSLSCGDVKDDGVAEIISNGIIFRVYRQGNFFFITQVSDINGTVIMNIPL